MRAPKLLLLVTGLAIGVVVGLSLHGSDAAPSPVPAASADGPDAEPAAAATGAAATPAEAIDAVAEAHDPDAAPADAGSQRSELPAAVVDLVTVRVVTGDPPQPVPGARVLWLSQERWQALGPKLPPGLPEAELPERFGAAFTTGDDGTGQLPRLPGQTLLAAVHGDRFAFANLDLRRQREPVVLPLLLDETLQLQVRDRAGAPGPRVPLAVQAPPRQKDGVADRLWQGPSGSDGTATVRHLQLLRAMAPKGARLLAMIAAPLPQPVWVEVPAPAGTTPLSLCMPPAGAVEVTVVDATGTPVLTPCRANLRLAKPLPGVSLDPTAKGADLLVAPKPLGEAPVPFAPIGLGLELQLALRCDGDRDGWKLEVRGPFAAGETVRLPAPLPADRLLVAGQALLPDGRALADADLAAAFAPIGVPARQLRERTARTLGDGRFDFVLRPTAPTSAAYELRTTLADGTIVGARGTVPVFAGGRRCDLGIVPLQPLPPLVSGQVEDDRGEPLAGARVQIDVEARDGDGIGQFAVPLLAASSGADGSFVLYGARPPGNLRVHAEKGGHAPAFAPLLGPGSRLTLVLPRLANLLGEARLPDWLPRGAATLRLVGVDDPRRQREQPVERRRLVVRDLLPGVYDLTVRVRNLPDPVLLVRDLRLQPGDNRDPRLDPLDLTRAVFRWRLRAVGGAGEALASLTAPILARLPKADGSLAEVAFRWQQGKAELIAASLPLDLVLFGRGLPPVRLTLPPGDHDVYLPRLQPCVIYLPGLRGIVGPDRAVRVSTVFTGQTGLPESVAGTDQRTGEAFSFPRWELSKSSGAWLGAGDTVEVPLSRNGPHDVILRIGADGNQNGRQASVPLGTIDARVDGPTPVVHTMAVDPVQIGKAIANLTRGGRRGR